LGGAETDAVFRRCIAPLTGVSQFSLSDRIFLILQKKIMAAGNMSFFVKDLVVSSLNGF